MPAAMNRISYFVPTKRPGLAVGPVNPDQLESLLKVLEDAREQKKPIVFFLWANQPDPEKGKKSIATLTVAVGQDRPEVQSVGRRPIANTEPPKRNAAMDNFFGGDSGKPKQAAPRGW